MKILFIRPIISDREDRLEEEVIRPFASEGTEVTARRIPFGPSSIENEYDLCFSSPFVVEEAVRAQQEGFDGVVSYCFANPGVDACREAVHIPCLGSGDAAISLGLSIGRRLGIITILPNILPLLRRQNEYLVQSGRIASVRSAGIPVTEIAGHEEDAEQALLTQARACVGQDGADVIILGCTGFGGMADKLQRSLARDGCPVSVVDPAGASVRMMEALISCGISQGRTTYMNAIEKKMALPHRKVVL